MELRSEIARIKQERLNAPPEPSLVPALPSLLWPYTDHRLGLDDIDEEHLRRLEQAVCWGWSDKAAAQHAGLPMPVFRQLLKRPEVKDHLDLLRQRPELVARRNVAMSLEEGDITTTKWFLERKVPEYSPKSQVDITSRKEVDEASVVGALQRLIDLSQRRATALVAEVEEEMKHLSPEAVRLLS